MRRALVALSLLVFIVDPAFAKDVALILNDQQRLSLAQVLDLATKAYGLQIAPATVQLKALLDAAPTVTGQANDDKPAEPKGDTK